MICNKKLIEELKNYEIHYKDGLDLSKTVLFGLEIEYESLKEINFTLPKFWINKKEETIPDGGEINSNPMIDCKNTWDNLKYVLDKLKENGAKIYDCASGHIHFDSQILKRDFNTWIKLVKTWILYEPIIYRFSMGNNDKLRTLCMMYAFYLRQSLMDKLDNMFCCCDEKELIDYLSNVCSRCYGLCLRNVDNNIDKNTIEIRCPNGNLESVIWQNNINFFSHLLTSINDKTLDEELYNYEIKKINNEPRYGEHYLDLNIELANKLSDFIYTKDEDKMSFLKQYTKFHNDKNDLFSKC